MTKHEYATAVDDVVTKGRFGPGRSYNEAVANDDASDWIKAVESEIASHAKNGTSGQPITNQSQLVSPRRSFFSPLGKKIKKYVT